MRKELYSHLRFELLYSLLFSEHSFENASYSLNHPGTLQSWQESEKTLVYKIPGIHLEHLNALRDELIASPGHGLKTYQDILSDQAQLFLAEPGNQAQLSGELRHDTLAKWRWLEFSLPADLLVAASGSVNSPYEVTTGSPLLERHWLDHGLAQTHVHLGAQTDFPTYWAGAMQALASEDVQSNALASEGAVFSQGKHFAPWLLAGAITRLLLCGFLLEKQQHRSTLSLTDYLQQVARQLEQTSWPDAGFVLNQLVNSLLQPAQLPEVSFRELQELYRLLMPECPKVKSLQDVWRLDPLIRLGPKDVPLADREIYSQRIGFAYLTSEQGAKDELFAILFWQAIRLKVLFYRHIVQRPSVKGLQWFIRHYDRIAALAKPAKKLRLEQAFHLDGGAQGLRSLEVRIAPDEDSSEIRKKVFESAEAWLKLPSHAGTEVGLVVHLPKVRNSETFNLQQSFPHHWLDSHANPENHPSHYRYSQYVNLSQRKVNAYVQHLQQVPLSIALLRGTDMCTDEISIPNWVMGPLLAQMDQAGKQAAQEVRYLYLNWKITPPKKTMHVGEDFFHLLDGIRRMDEVITRFPLERGDRIGHGLALGLSPKRWVEQHPIVWMPKEIRLWDLIWEWKQYRLGLAKTSNSRLEKIKDLVSQYAREIFGPECQTQDVCQLYEQLFDPDKLERVGFPNGEKVMAGLDQLTSQNRDFYWLYTYLTDSHCFHRCYQVVEIHNTSDEQEALYAMQRAVRQRVCQKEITIEVNPSSNFMLADLQNLEHHPLWNLNPPPGHQLEEEMGPAVHICIGSDDPITFATNLPQEYELLYNVLLQKGIGSTAALQWLDKVRQAGLNARFTLSFGPQNHDADQVWHQLLRDLKADWQPQDARL